MQRNLRELSDAQFDVLVVGGGAAGAAAAREAALRGLRTALIEREDFGSGTSAHCFKVVHGGIRYLQHGDLRRLRASCHERQVLLRLAPHLVEPLPFALPTYGRGRNGRWLLGTGMLLYDALTLDRNRGIRDPARAIARTRFLSRGETLGLFPGIEARHLTGAAVFEDAQMHNPPRLVLAFVAAAEALGARVANYVEAEHFLKRKSRICGVVARDRLSGLRFEVRARVVINATGAWAEGLLTDAGSAASARPGSYSRDVCLVVSRRPFGNVALGVQVPTRDGDALLSRHARHVFLAPWRGVTLIGVWHRIVPRDPDACSLSREELATFVREVNAGFPAFGLAESEVQRVDFGLVPFGGADSQAEGALSFGKQSRLIDHRRSDALPGLITVISVRYTVARRDAVAALDIANEHLDIDARAPDSASRSLPGGDIGSFAVLMDSAQRDRPHWMSAAAAQSLARNYGTHFNRVLRAAESERALQQCIAGTDVTYAQVAHCVRHEMAQRMTDVVFRRTELGTAGHPGEAALRELQAFMQQELGWTLRRAAEERCAVDLQFRRFLTPAAALREIA